MKNRWLPYFLGGFALLVVACQPSTTSNPIRADRYGFKKIDAYVRYLEARREWYAEITFRADSTQQLEKPVSINGELLLPTQRPKVGLQYSGTKTAINFDREQTFSYTEKDGSQQKIEIILPAFDSATILSQKMLSHKEGGLLGWKGALFDKEDAMVLLFTDAEGQVFSVNHNGQTNGTQYQILPEVAQRLALGPARLDITRKRVQIHKTDEQTQWSTIEYYYRPILFEVKP